MPTSSVFTRGFTGTDGAVGRVGPASLNGCWAWTAGIDGFDVVAGALCVCGGSDCAAGMAGDDGVGAGFTAGMPGDEGVTETSELAGTTTKPGGMLGGAGCAAA